MLQEAYFICVSAQCKQDRILNDWESIVAHQNEGHEVLEKEDLINTINTKLNKKKATLLQDLLARIHKIMINQEDALISLINQTFFETYKNWKEQIQSYQQYQDYLLPNQIDEDTKIQKLIDVYQNLDNEQLHFFKDCLYQTEHQYNELQKQIKMHFVKTEQELKLLQQSLFNQIKENKRQREYKLQHKLNDNKILAHQQYAQQQSIPIFQKDKLLTNTIENNNMLKEIQLKCDFQIQKDPLNLGDNNQQRDQPQKNHYIHQENGNGLTTNINNNKLNDKPQKYIVLTKQKDVRKNQHFEQQSSLKQDYYVQSQSPNLLSEPQEIQSTDNIIRANSAKQITDIIPQNQPLPLRGYKDNQQQYQNNIIQQNTQNMNSKIIPPPDQSVNKTNDIVHELSLSPQKPPPLKGYKDRQTEEQKVIKLARSNDKRNYLDTDQIKEIQQNTSKRFDIDKSEKHMKYSNKFSTIFSIKECFAVVEGVFKLTEQNQFHIYIRSSVENYEIEAGMINLTQIKQKQVFPKLYGLNEKGECLSSQTKTTIKLLLNCSYLFAFRKEEKTLVCLDLMKNIQYAIQIPNDENSDYVFFIKMSNLEVQLI
ncbi:unnamed protein product (macronuclear) [Paramecium tetraurelia]|uniref:Uncharacterized protein n=1 Tax=Paramecium tetraurelia TaxID=5888 RepID=A0CUH4_PARTE|nr:uncharacterized protein GSPATT00010641001 [Paramecium tetraurelia]CAK74441.1 unnamed protein product [Paramecium tetraurelia]|eukprot:XP_001441838.1 hypothetical protein (macronuclear) [Paramecium tetraurelia strain d4-2]